MVDQYPELNICRDYRLTSLVKKGDIYLGINCSEINFFLSKSFMISELKKDYTRKTR